MNLEEGGCEPGRGGAVRGAVNLEERGWGGCEPGRGGRL